MKGKTMLEGVQKLIVNGLANIQHSVEEGRYGKKNDMDITSLEEDLILEIRKRKNMPAEMPSTKSWDRFIYKKT